MKYFAYGSNMNPQRMREREVRFSERIPAILKGYTLRFNKVASRNNCEGFANIATDAKGVVEGVLYEIPDNDLKKLDVREGYPDHYDRLKVRVLTSTGEEEAITYVACPNKVAEGLNPSREYLAHLMAAMGMLSEKYYQRLNSTHTLD